MTEEISYFRNNSDVNIRVLYHFIKAFGVESALELGVQDAESTCTMLAALGTNPLWSVDTSETANLKEYVSSKYPDANWTFIRADDKVLSWNTKIDLLFVDTSHSEEHTRIELEKYGTYAQKLIVLHDAMGCSGVKAATEEYARTYQLPYFYDKRR